MYKASLVTLFLLAGCAGEVHVSCPDAGPPPALPDAGPPPSFNARVACGIHGRWYVAQRAANVLASDCPQLACPFPFDPIDPASGRCDPALVEHCVVELEARANDCAGYQAVIDDCAARAEAGGCW